MREPVAFDPTAPVLSARTALMHDRNTQLHTVVFTLHWVLNVVALHVVNKIRREADAGDSKRSTPGPRPSTPMLLARHHVRSWLALWLEGAPLVRLLVQTAWRAEAGSASSS